MDGYVKGILELAEQASSPATPDTGFAKAYFKADGNLYIKDDTGAETQITGAGGTGSGINEHQWSPKELGLTTATNSTYANAVATPTVKMPDGSDSFLVTPKWRVTQTLIDEIAGGKSLFLGVHVEASSSGDVSLSVILEMWDESAVAWVPEMLPASIKSVVGASKMNEFKFEFTKAPAIGDMLAFQVKRSGGAAGDTLGTNLDVTTLRVFADTGAGS